MRRLICDSGRTALTNGRQDAIFLAYSDTGIFAGATFEVTASELREDELNRAAELVALRQAREAQVA